VEVTAGGTGGANVLGCQNEPVSGQAGRYQRSPAGMVGAMLVLVAVVVGFVVFRDVNRADPADPVRAVDYGRDADFAREQASFDLVAPPSLPDGWRATTVEYVPGPDDRWHLGILTGQDRYVGLEQSADSVATMVETHVDPDATKGAPVLVDGVRWSSYTDSGGDRALVLRTGGTTTLVVGHEVPQADLVTFAASLR
jgi:uncharacterized protein DUF4245